MTTDGSIHYVDAARKDAQPELRTVCGVPTPRVQWTTVRGAATCTDCVPPGKREGQDAREA